MTNTTCCQSGCLFLHKPIFPPSITLSLLGLKSSRGYISESLPALFSARTSSEVNTFYFYFANGKKKQTTATTQRLWFLAVAHLCCVFLLFAPSQIPAGRNHLKTADPLCLVCHLGLTFQGRGTQNNIQLQMWRLFIYFYYLKKMTNYDLIGS